MTPTEETTILRDGTCYRTLPNGTFRQLRDVPEFRTIDASDWKRVLREPIARNPVADGIRAHLGPGGPGVGKQGLNAENGLKTPVSGPPVTLPYAKDSATSKAAAESMQTQAQKDAQRIMDRVTSAGALGLTCDEIEVLLDLSHQTASARINGLVKDGKLVRATNRVRPTRTGHAASVLVAPQWVKASVGKENLRIAPPEAAPAPILPPKAAIPAPARVEVAETAQLSLF